MPVTLQEIADQTGVSKRLVSIVVNGKAKQYRISDNTAQRVLEKVQELGYDPNLHHGARQMAARRHGMRIPNDVIAVSSAAETFSSKLEGKKMPFSLLNHPYESEVMHGVEVAANQRNMDVLICRHFGDRLPRLLEKGEVDGVILLTASAKTVSDIKGLDLPRVMLVSKVDGFHNVVVENENGIYLATRHLIQLGHQEIAYIGHRVADDVLDTILMDAAQARLRGFNKALSEFGLSSKYVDTSLSAQTKQVAAEAAEKLWQASGGQLTAFVCYNDMMAMGVMDYLQNVESLKVPDDVSVTGFDDISASFEIQPKLTSVYYDRFELGQQAVDLIYQSRAPWLAGKHFELATRCSPVQLMIGGSTGKPPVRK